MHYYVIGINGSGKTTILRAIYEQLGIPVIHGTTELMKFLGIPGDYDKLRNMDQDFVLSKWGETATYLNEKYRGKDFLLDTHILNLTQGKIIRRDGPWVAQYDSLVEIKAEPTITLERIQKDRERDRAMFPAGISDNEKLKLLVNYQDETNRLFEELAKRYNLPNQVIDNNGDIQNAIDSFASFHQTFTGA